MVNCSSCKGAGKVHEHAQTIRAYLKVQLSM